MTPFILVLTTAGLALAGDKLMTPLDVMHIRDASAGTLSRDAKRFACTISVLDWKAGKRFTDIWITDTASGERRQFTFTPDRNETAPAFSPDGSLLAFLSDRAGSAAAPTSQLYLMPLSGGEARQVSEIAGGVSSYAFSRDGQYLAMLAGRGEKKQIYLTKPGSAEAPKPIARHATGVETFAWAPDSARIYFTAPDSISAAEQKRMELKFDVRIADQPKPPVHLWEVTLEEHHPRRLTSGSEFTVKAFRAAEEGGWISVLSGSAGRHDTDIASRKNEAWLLHAPSAKLERLTDNAVSEQLPVISPDGKWLAMAAPDGYAYFRRSRIYVRATAGGEWRKLPADSWPHDPGGIAWLKDSSGLTFDAGVGATNLGFVLPLSGGEPRPLITGDRSVNLSYHEPSGLFLVDAQDSNHPRDYFLATEPDLRDPAKWKRLTEANPSISEFALGKTETIRWKSTDGTLVEGLLVKPVGFASGRRYPLLVQVHGGPASATTHRFAGSYSRYDHVFAGKGYAVLHPNYRGSTNYGEKFKTAIVGNYFPQGFDDIMTGVDHLIAQGIADPDKLGMMGWSAGGHWSNWTLTHTNRFKAISSGAGAMNWVSMYAQNDSQANREHYFVGTPYDNFDHWMAMSPIKYVKNAKTPTLIHVGHDDQRVPRPQSEELHMALKKLGVPVEFIVYPRMGHGLTEPRYQMVKMVAELGWFEKWIKGAEKWLDWQELADGVPAAPKAGDLP